MADLAAGIACIGFGLLAVSVYALLFSSEGDGEWAKPVATVGLGLVTAGVTLYVAVAT